MWREVHPERSDNEVEGSLSTRARKFKKRGEKFILSEVITKSKEASQPVQESLKKTRREVYPERSDNKDEGSLSTRARK